MAETYFDCSVPIIPARDIAVATAWYRDHLGYTVHRVQADYGIVGRDGSWIHFWGPSGIEPHDSMTMIRIGVEGIDELYAHCQERGIVHPNGPLCVKPWRMREFAVIDCDGNLVTFFESISLS